MAFPLPACLPSWGPDDGDKQVVCMLRPEYFDVSTSCNRHPPRASNFGTTGTFVAIQQTAVLTSKTGPYVAVPDVQGKPLPPGLEGKHPPRKWQKGQREQGSNCRPWGVGRALVTPTPLGLYSPVAALGAFSFVLLRRGRRGGEQKERRRWASVSEP